MAATSLPNKVAPANDLTMHDTMEHQSKSKQTPQIRKRRKQNQGDESIAEALRKLLVRHQLGLSLNLILLLILTHVLFPSLRSYTTAFFTVSYSTETSGLYAQGPRDLYLVASFVVFFFAARASLLEYVFLPLAATCGIKKRKGRVRFAEQAYVLLYYGFYWAWGVYLFVADTPADVKDVNGLLVSLWRDFPRLLVPGGVKLYYLSQLAQWIQMVAVIFIEERRKDHWQMFAHHLVTIALMVGSYGYRQWRVGIAILVCMDLVDCIFPLAKILRYMSLQTACDIAFGAFVLAWIASRHVAYLAICWSIYAHVNTAGTMLYGTYATATGFRLSADGGSATFTDLLQPLTRPGAATFAFNANIRWFFLGLLMALQCITLAWLAMIMRVVAKVLRGQGAEDTRSDDEGEGDELDELVDDEEQQQQQQLQDPEAGADGADPDEKSPRFIEVATTSEEVSWPPARKNSINTNSRRKASARAISSGLNLGDHKEILNRIGCLSEEQLAREREARENSPRTPGAGGR